MRVILTKDGQAILRPSNDYIFKLLFGDERNKGILIAFLKAILNLPDEEYEIILMDPHLKKGGGRQAGHTGCLPEKQIR